MIVIGNKLVRYPRLSANIQQHNINLTFLYYYNKYSLLDTHYVTSSDAGVVCLRAIDAMTLQASQRV